MQDGDLVPAVEDAAQFAEQPGADDHRVGRVDENVDSHRLSHGALSHFGRPLPRVSVGLRCSAAGSTTTGRAATTAGAAVVATVPAPGDSPAEPRCGAPPPPDCGDW